MAATTSDASASLLHGYWLVMDMDGTVLSTPSKAGGHYLPLSDSPCHTHLVQWLELGGNLCVVSTAGRRMWRQVHDVVKASLVKPGCGRLLLSGFSGGAVFVNDRATGFMHEDEEYRHTAIEHGTVPTDDELELLLTIGESVVRAYLLAAVDDEAKITDLSKKYHDPYLGLVSQLREMGAERFFEDVLPRKKMLEYGAVLAATNDALIDVQTIPGTEPLAAAQVTVLGVPMKRFGDFFTKETVGMLEDRGLHVKAQPNSVCIVRSGVDKATLVRWLDTHGDRYAAGGFSLQRAIAFGDAPAVVDKPLTIFPGMAFVSLSPELAATPTAAHCVHVGGEEVGTAHFLAHLVGDAVAAVKNHHDSGDDDSGAAVRHFTDSAGAVSIEAVRRMAGAARQRVEEGS